MVIDTAGRCLRQAPHPRLPLAALRKATEKAQSFHKRFSQLFGQEDTVELTPDLVERFVANGWDRKMLEDPVRHGARYSPSRDTILKASIAGGFGDDDDEFDDGDDDEGPKLGPSSAT